jgi:putative DNA primase/helicase
LGWENGKNEKRKDAAIRSLSEVSGRGCFCEILREVPPEQEGDKKRMPEGIKIEIDMDRACAACCKKGATQNGLCLKCIAAGIKGGGGPCLGFADPGATGPDDMRQQVEDRVKREKTAAPGGVPARSGNGIDSKFIHECLGANELGDGTLYATVHRDVFIYCKNSQEWYEWAGHYWTRDNMNRSMPAVESVVKLYLDEYKRISNEIADLAASNSGDEEIKRKRGQQAQLLKRTNQLRGDRRRVACLKFAHTIDKPLAITGEEFDVKPMLFPCANGVIDLETGTLIPGCPGDYLSLSSPVPFLGINEPAMLWEQSLNEIFNGNNDLIAYLQRLFGYAMTGLVNEKVFPVMYGKTGWNGRSLIVETISHVMGDLAGSIPAEMLLSQRYSRSASGPAPDIMSLKGIRLAFASEIDEGQRFSASKIKWLTGKDELVGRHPHDKYQTRFQPTHKLFLMTNTQPQAPPNDKAFWWRLHLIPFNISFVNRDPQESSERRAILDLDQQILKEASGILAWLVRGCLLWQRHGLMPPREITEATEQYRRNEDMLADFIDECCIVEPGAKEKAAAMYARFVEWYHENIGKSEPSGTWFGKQLGMKYDKWKSEGVVMYRGIALGKQGGLDG